MADFFSKSFNVHIPGSNNSLVSDMNDFINTFACEREELSTFLKQTWALNLTMLTSAKKIYFYLGLDGDNGKSQVRKLLSRLCGDFCTSLDKDMLVRSPNCKGRATT